MKAKRIPAHEADFAERGIDGYGKFHRLTRQRRILVGTDEDVEYVSVTPLTEDETYFFESPVEKDQIVLHFSEGFLKGDIARLTTPDYRVSTPYVIARNGTIYNLFYAGFWAYHLGPRAIGGNATRSRATIGIELSNIGPLRKVGAYLATRYSEEDHYCLTSETGLYCKAPFRGYEYYATFTDAQYESLIRLLRYLGGRFGIPLQCLPEAKRYLAFPEIKHFRGIVTHANYRYPTVLDIGPAFDWERVINGIRQPVELALQDPV